MQSDTLVRKLTALDLTCYPDVHALDSDLAQILWALLVAKEGAGTPELSAGDVERLLRDVCGIDISRQKATALLAEAKGLVAVKNKRGRRAFTIMKKGHDFVASAGETVTIIDPANALTAIRKVQAVLGSVVGEVLLCDPYADGKTLDLLTEVPKSSQIRLLTATISNPQRFAREVKAYSSQHGNLEVRLTAVPVLHDRYLIDDTQMLILGHSLNGIGKKQSFIVRAGDDTRLHMRQMFLDHWAKSAPFA